jgi:hypothetical protein
MGLLQRIKWIKNVKRNEGADWAYMEPYESDSLLLVFAPEHSAGADKASVGDVIVLFQTVNKTINWPGGTYLTHLVLVDSLEAQDTGRFDYPRGRRVLVLARTSPFWALRSVDIGMSFKNVNTGQLCDFNLFNKAININSNHSRIRIIELLAPYF